MSNQRWSYYEAIQPKTVAIIQARMGSTRLPGKTLSMIGEKPLLAHIIERIKASQLIDEIVVSTTKCTSDYPIILLAKKCGVMHFKGSEIDVLDRFYNTAKKFNAEIILRVTADNPFVDPEVIDEILRHLINNPGLDYASNTIEPTYPDGINIEAFNFNVLETAWHEAELTSEREHVTPFIWKNPKRFNIFSVKSNVDLSRLRWTIDYYEDLCFAREIYSRLSYKGIFLMQDILQILKAEPELIEINGHIERNIGYKLSLSKDRLAHENR